MLNRRNGFVLFCLLLIVGSVVADPPITTDSYQSVIRLRPSSRNTETQPAAAPKGTSPRVAAKASAANVRPAQMTDAEAQPLPIAKPLPAGASAPGCFPPSPPCDACFSCDPYGCGRSFHGRGGWQYRADPFGYCVFGALDAQITSGLAAQLVLYRYDFNNPPTEGAAKSIDPANLNPRGRQQLMKVADLLNRLPMPPVVIEASENPQIDQARRQRVIAALTEVMGTPVPNEWVVVDEPAANPLSGEEATLIHQNLLQQTELRGLYDANDRSSQSQNANTFPTSDSINQ